MQRSLRVTTLADVIFPQSTLLRTAGLIIGFSLLNALAAQVRVVLPFTPVPITGQTFVVLLTGVLLGSRLGMATMVAYLAQGVAGLPVFTGWGAGPAVLFGPTGGYLIGFVVAAYVVGLLAERGWDRRVWLMALAMIVGSVIIYALGTTWLAQFVGVENAFVLGVVPFLPGDAIKIVLAMIGVPAGWKLLGSRTY